MKTEEFNFSSSLGSQVTVILLFFLSPLNGSCFLISKSFSEFQCLELIDFGRFGIVLGDWTSSTGFSSLFCLFSTLKKNKHSICFDKLFLFVPPVLGWLRFSLWFVTLHKMYDREFQFLLHVSSWRALVFLGQFQDGCRSTKRIHHRFIHPTVNRSYNQ